MYRAGDGCHREWLGKRSILEPFIKRMSFALNPLHLTLLYLEKQCFSNSRVIIANSMMVKSDIKKHYSIPDEKIKVIYNGVDLKRFSPPEKEQKKAEKNSLGIKEVKVILFAGSDFKRKGLGTLLRAAASLDMTDKKIIAAGKEHPHQYISLAKKLGIEDKVVFRGAERDMERLYRISDVFVLPTVYDPFSNATLEAMASGLPVVTTSSNGASELIENGVQGFVINDPLDADSFAGAVSKTLKQSDEMGRQARIKAEGFSIEKAVDEIIGVISELTNAV
ncbi:MAG: glycosyltransferase family 4 protein [Nitrospirae bacterium]|nr:glycosyltransferase family 4 protein [Nitrospirota bacterium]